MYIYNNRIEFTWAALHECGVVISVRCIDIAGDSLFAGSGIGRHLFDYSGSWIRDIVI